MTEITINQVAVARMNVGPDEVVMVTASIRLTDESAFRIKEAFKRAFKETGGNVPPILVIDNNLKVEIVRRAGLALTLPIDGSTEECKS